MNDEKKNKQGVLKEEMIYQKTRTQNLKDVKALNMWGYGLEDISIASRLVNAETICFSINKIQTLEPFQTCRKLHNLLLRQNLISDINEIQYLADLPDLKNLTLTENPIASLPGYRETVISILPQLEKLDEVDVSMKLPPRVQKQSNFQRQQPKNQKQPPNHQKRQRFYEDLDEDEEDFNLFMNYDNDTNNNRRRSDRESNDFNEVTPVKKQFNILEKIDHNPPAQTFKKMDKNQPRMNYNQTYNPSVNNFNNNHNNNSSPSHHSPTNALDEHLLTAVLSLIPELSVESLQIVLEAIRDRCK